MYIYILHNNKRTIMKVSVYIYTAGGGMTQ